MKRCPTCQSVYTDESLSYCLQDGSKLVTMSGSASSADATWQLSGASAGRSTGGEPPPTEILKLEDMPTTRMEPTAPTREQQRARPTALDREPQPSMAAPRSSAAVIALSITVALLLLALGGLIVWVMMRDKNQTEPRAATANSNQGVTSQSNTTTTTTRASSNANQSANTTPQPSPVDVAAARGEVQAALNAWADTIRQRNLDEHLKYYADVLDVYYSAKNVSRTRVRDDRSAAFSKYTSMDIKLTNVNIEIEPSGTSAIATFDKTFDFRGSEKNFSGSGLNRFWFTKAGGRWRITGEKDLKTYYINN